MSEYKYDVAISFLSQDLPVAEALFSRLSEQMEIFFYPRSQEAIAGTDGTESFKGPFLNEARIAVVLYRDQWGKTPWTSVEQQAIKERCMTIGWDKLFVIALDTKDELPLWLPKTHMRLNYEQFGLEGAIGAIKARVIESGGRIEPLTAIRKAEAIEREAAYQLARGAMKTSDGISAIHQKVKDLFEAIKVMCENIAEKNNRLEITAAWSFDARAIVQQCIMSDTRIGTSVEWRQRYGNSIDSASLHVVEYNRPLIVRHAGIFLPPKQLGDHEYFPDFSRAGEYGWVKKGKLDRFLGTAEMADHAVGYFLELISRCDQGKISHDFDWQ